MEKFYLEKPVLEFLEDVALKEKIFKVRTVNALISYFKQAHLSSSLCKDLLELEGTMALKIRGFNRCGYIHICDTLREKYTVPLGEWPFFKEYINTKNWVEKENAVPKILKKQKRVEILRRTLNLFREKSKECLSDEKKAEKLLIELEKLILE